ncbi:perilipin-3-like isoform X2 [Apostichopus japonicus]|uniref:perilipin-3-like isoform X2 n=1 Tax=Stichopus japonicus TaxID=307972 RepID=UPI003AB80ADB
MEDISHNSVPDNSVPDNSLSDNSITDKNSENQVDDNAISRFTNLPIVTSALTSVSDAYQWTKDSNALIGYSLGMAEKSVALAAYTAQPVVSALERPLSAVNSMANQQLDMLEEKVPILTEPSDEVVKTLKESAWTAVEHSKVAGTQKMNQLMDTRVGQVVASTVDAALQLSDMAVDYCLPDEKAKSNEAEVEQEKDASEEKGVTENEVAVPSNERFSHSVNRASQVSTKVRKRLYHKALVNIQYAQRRSEETLQKLHFTVDLIQYAKENIDSANSGMKSKVDSTQENLWRTWNDWTTDHNEDVEKTSGEEDEDVEGKTGEEKTLAIARNLSRRLRNLTINLSTSIRVLPQNLRQSVEDARSTAEVLFTTFEEAQYFKDLPSSILTGAKDRLVQLTEGSVMLADYLVNSPAMQWLVPAGFQQLIFHSRQAISHKEKSL